MTMSLLMLITLTMGGQLRAQVHTAPRPRQATDSECVGTLKAYKVRTSGESAVKTDKTRPGVDKVKHKGWFKYSLQSSKE